MSYESGCSYSGELAVIASDTMSLINLARAGKDELKANKGKALQLVGCVTGNIGKKLDTQEPAPEVWASQNQKLPNDCDTLEGCCVELEHIATQMQAHTGTTSASLNPLLIPLILKAVELLLKRFVD